MKTEPIEHWLLAIRQIDEERYALLSRLRKLVLMIGPGVTEEFKYGGLLFSAGSPFCGLFSYPHHVALEFSRGADLPNADQVLEGEGKKRRHIKVTGGQDLYRKNLREHLRQAYDAVQAVAPLQRGRRVGHGAR